MEKILLPVGCPSLASVTGCVIMCHPLFKLDKVSATVLVHTLLLISEGISPKKQGNSASGFSAGFLRSWS